MKVVHIFGDGEPVYGGSELKPGQHLAIIEGEPTMTTEKLVAAKVEALWEMREWAHKQTIMHNGDGVADKVWDEIKARHGLCPPAAAPACPHTEYVYTPDPSGNNDSSYTCKACGKELTLAERRAARQSPPDPALRWPGVEVVQATNKLWDVRTSTHWLNACREWKKRDASLDFYGDFGTRKGALSALNDPRTPPPPHVAEKPAEEFGKALDERKEAVTFGAPPKPGDTLVVNREPIKVPLLCEVTAERDRLAADNIVMKGKIVNFEKWVKSLLSELRAAKKPGRKKGAKKRGKAK